MSELTAAPPVVLVHAACALVALLLGGYQLYSYKGTPSHRVLGYVWVSLMMTVAFSSFWIHGIRQFGDFSLIHLLSLYVAIGLPFAVLAARRGNVNRHRISMQSFYIGGLIVAGILTLAPGRLLGQLVFGW
jgi:uncharacterized membrane protein